jgi:vacuolar-type H+-ATPase subunit F/Vma7
MTADSPHTRMIAIGSEAVVTGFSMIGFESVADPEPDEVRELVEQLEHTHQRAFLIIEQYMAQKLKKLLHPLQQEGGDILIMEVPAINEPEKLTSWLSSRIEKKYKSSLVGGS